MEGKGKDRDGTRRKRKGINMMQISIRIKIEKTLPHQQYVNPSNQNRLITVTNVTLQQIGRMQSTQAKVTRSINVAIMYA